MVTDKTSGLILPEHILKEQQVQETWLYNPMLKKLRYTAKMLDERDVDMTLTCRRCGQPLQMEMSHSLIEGSEDQPTGKLVCKCKVRTIR